MTSNTKLTKNEKEILCDLQLDFPHVQFATDYDSIVIAYFQDGKVVRFAVSVKSPDEKKFRLKVGKLRAMESVLPVLDNVNTILPEDHFFEMLYAIGCDVIEPK
jgi:hypothetical protein